MVLVEGIGRATVWRAGPHGRPQGTGLRAPRLGGGEHFWALRDVDLELTGQEGLGHHQPATVRERAPC